MMEDLNWIDRLFRSKLKDRPFEASEAGWEEMAEMLDKAERGSGFRNWGFRSLAILVIVTSAYFVWNMNTSNPVAAVENEINEQVTTVNEGETTGIDESAVRNHTMESASEIDRASKAPEVEEEVHKSSLTTTPSEQDTQDQAATSAVPAVASEGSTPAVNLKTQQPSSVLKPGEKNEPKETHKPDLTHLDPPTLLADKPIEQGRPNPIESLSKTGSSQSTPDQQMDPANPTASASTASHGDTPPVASPSTSPPEKGGVTLTSPAEMQGKSAKVSDPHALPTASMPTGDLPSRTAGDQPASPSTSTGQADNTTQSKYPKSLSIRRSDSTDTTLDHTNDSNAIATTDTSAAAPLAPPTGPPAASTEVPALPNEFIHGHAGGHTSRQQITGNGTANSIIENGTSSLLAPSIGLEYFKKTGGFYVGSGLHYTRSRAELDIPDRSTTSIQLVDTIVQVLDSVWTLDSTAGGGQGMWVTMMVNDTIQDTTFTQSTLTGTRTTLIQSHVRIPLLFGYRKRLNKFILGVDLGPTVNILTGQQGVYPTTDLSANQVVSTEQFRRVSLGYLIRPSIHYALNEQISIGFEPYLYGQFQGSTNAGVLQDQRFANYGFSLGLTYNLTRPQTSTTP